MTEQGVNITTAGTESNEVIFTATAATVLGFLQITNQSGNGSATCGVKILDAASALLHDIVPSKSIADPESFPMAGAWVLNSGEKLAVDCDTADVTFHFAMSAA